MASALTNALCSFLPISKLLLNILITIAAFMHRPYGASTMNVYTYDNVRASQRIPNLLISEFVIRCVSCVYLIACMFTGACGEKILVYILYTFVHHLKWSCI